MKPLNQEIRNNALSRFIGLYLVTVFIIGALVYLTAFTMPSENANLNSSTHRYHQQFYGAIDSLNHLFVIMNEVEEEIVWQSHATRVATLLVSIEKQLALEKKDNPFLETVLSSYTNWIKDKQLIWDAKMAQDKLHAEIVLLKGGAGGPNPALELCEKQIAKNSTMASNILNQIDMIKKDVDKLKGIGDRRQKKSINNSLERIRGYADRIQD